VACFYETSESVDSTTTRQVSVTALSQIIFVCSHAVCLLADRAACSSQIVNRLNRFFSIHVSRDARHVLSTVCLHCIALHCIALHHVCMNACVRVVRAAFVLWIH
jgi:hypothetical protein